MKLFFSAISILLLSILALNAQESSDRERNGLSRLDVDGLTRVIAQCLVDEIQFVTAGSRHDRTVDTRSENAIAFEHPDLDWRHEPESS